MVVNASLKNLWNGQNRGWQHTPTAPIRVPVRFKDEVLAFTRALDDGQQTVATLGAMSLDELLSLQAKLPELIAAAREATCDRTLEEAISYLAGCCDGAVTDDAAGFRAIDTEFGHWLAREWQAGNTWQRHHAQMALKMVAKYQRTQLGPQGIVLPQWETIEHQYPERQGHDSDAQAEYRLELHGERIYQFSPYDPDELAKIKAIEPRGRFNGDDKSWRFPLAAAALLLENFGQYEYVDPAIAFVAEEQRWLAEEAEQQRLAAQHEEEQRRLAAAQLASAHLQQLIDSAQLQEPLPCGWSLFEHQQRAVEWLLAHRRGGIYHGGILADHMGLGKTISALVAAKALKAEQEDCPVLVLCPSSLRDNWAREAEKVGVTIETFSWAKVPQPLERQHYILIADEAHYAQNARAARTKKFLALAQAQTCVTAWLLTGTPIKNGRPINLLPLLDAIAHPLAQDQWNYKERYCDAHQKWVGNRAVWDMSGAAYLTELSEKTQDAILRRTKADCLDLPAKQRIFKPTEIEPKVLKRYKQEIADLALAYRERVKNKEVSPEAEALVTLGNLRRVGSNYKIDAAVQQIEELLEQGQQVVVFTEYLESAKTIHEKVEGAVLLTGETPQDQRQQLVDQFQEAQAKVFVGTICAGGVGLTLTAASHVILVDRPWTPGDAEQAEDRCHRIGQSQSVSAIWLQLGDIDQAVDALIDEKQERIDLVLKGKRKTLRGVGNINDLAQQLLKVL